MSENWTLSGTYFESCNCDVACPCIFLSDPTPGECTALVGWHIDEGQSDGLALSGLNVALAVHAPGNMAKTQWKVAVYLDQRASEGQRNALLKIFGGQAGGHPARLATHIGEIVGVKFVEIDFSRRDGQYALTIPTVADVEIDQQLGQGKEPITISGHPLCIAPGFTATLAQSNRFSYDDHGMSWALSGKNGLFSPFAYQN